MKIKLTPEISKDQHIIDYRENEFTNSKTSNNLINCVRELLQNSWDAFDDNKPSIKEDKLKFRICYQKLDQKMLKCLPFSDYKDFLKRSIKCYSNDSGSQRMNNNDNKKSSEKFLENVNEDIYCLIIEDNAGGLTGETIYSSDPVGSKAIDNPGMSVKKSRNSKGTYGKGKKTAFSLSNLRTVFYVNHREGKTLFLGKSNVNPVDKKIEENHTEWEGPNIYWGQQKDIAGNKKGDWMQLNGESSSIKDLRIFTSDGLSTIILMTKQAKEWVYQCVYSIISSYFKILDDKETEITIEDRVNEEKLEIKNLDDCKKYLPEFKQTKLYQEEDEFKNEYDKIETFVNNEAVNEYKENFDLNVKGQNKSFELKFKLFEFNNEDDSINENGIPKQNFNFIRDGMVLRNEFMIKRDIKFSNGKYFYGYVYTDNDELNEIISIFEPPSHDIFDPYLYSDTDQIPKKITKPRALSIFKNKIKRWILKKIQSKIQSETNTQERTTWNFRGGQKDIGDDNETNEPTYRKSYKINKENLKEIDQVNTVLLTEGPVKFLDKNGKEFTHKIDRNSKIVEYVRKKPKPRPGPPGPPNPDPPVGKRTIDKDKKDQPARLETGMVNKKYFQSKLIKREGVVAEYKIELDADLSGHKNIVISQETIGRGNKTVSFNLLKAYINGGQMKISETKNQKTTLTTGFQMELKKQSISTKKNILTVRLEELNSTVSTFELKTS